MELLKDFSVEAFVQLSTTLEMNPKSIRDKYVAGLMSVVLQNGKSSTLTPCIPFGENWRARFGTKVSVSA